MIRATLDLSDNTLTYDGGTTPMDHGGLSLLRELAAAEDPDTEVLIPRQVVYTGRWNRNSVEILSLDSYAETMSGRPVLHEHDDTRRLGVGGPGLVVDIDGLPAIVQDITLNTRAGLELLAAGGTLEYSVGSIDNKDNVLQCSICGEEWLTGDCDHLPWGTDLDADGDTWRLQLTSMRNSETSITHSPACEGTGPIVHSTGGAIMAIDQTQDRIVSHLRSQLDASAIELSALRDEVATLRTERDAIETARVEAEAAHRAIQAEQALVEVRKLRAARGLRIPQGMSVGDYEATLSAMYIDDRPTWDLLSGSIPETKISEVQSGAEIAGPEQRELRPGTTGYYQRLHDSAMQMAAETGQTPEECRVAILRAQK